jgi:hypothetical protein
MTRRAILSAFVMAMRVSIPSDAGAQGIHTPHDHVPNFAASPTIRSAGNGVWSSPSTWSPARLPAPSDVVSIAHSVTYDSTAGDASVIGIEAGGVLRFSVTQSTQLRVGTLLVLPNGTLEVGSAASPVSASATAQIIIKDAPLDPSADPGQFGTGLLAIDGTVTLHGAVKTPTFVRSAAEPRAGQTTITVERPVSGWRVGDRIFLPDTRQVPTDHWFNPNYALQIEERTIQAISADGRVLTLSTALSFDHRGARDADGTPTVVSGTIALLPHVGNLTRNVIIRSENPAGTRGHTLYTHRSTVAIHYTQFQDLGRTRATALHATANHIGRYPLHIHHVLGPVNPSNTGYQFTVVGNAIADSLKWPIAVHGSHYGLVKRNVIFGGPQLTGAGIAVEDGSETENLFEENFVANIRGSINPRESGPNTADGTTPGSAAECFWAAGFNNRFVNNVASSCRNPVQQIVSGPGWKFIVPAAPYTARNPRFRGADMANTAETVAVTPQHQPILEFRGNEVYGLAADGLTAARHRRLQHHAAGDARERHPGFPRLAHLRRRDLQLSVASDDRRWPGLSRRSGGDALLAVGVSVRRLPQRRRHDPERKHPRWRHIRRLYRPARCVPNQQRRRGDAWARLLVRDARNTGHRGRPSAVRRDDGAAEQPHSSLAWTPAADD